MIFPFHLQSRCHVVKEVSILFSHYKRDDEGSAKQNCVSQTAIVVA